MIPLSVAIFYSIRWKFDGVYTPASLRYLFLFTIYPVHITEFTALLGFASWNLFFHHLNTISLHHEKSMSVIITASIILEEKLGIILPWNLTKHATKLVIKPLPCKQVLIVTSMSFFGSFQCKACFISSTWRLNKNIPFILRIKHIVSDAKIEK